jgi:heat shock protein HtpX
MASYVGLHEQIRRNNLRSALILAGFPLIILAAVYVVIFFTQGQKDFEQTGWMFVRFVPVVVIAVGIWFLIAWFANASMIRLATNSRPLERRENMRIYNLTENLCITAGMPMPKLYVIDSPALNAFASGIDKNSFAVTLTTGIIDHLSDEELEGVIAHELTHIRNKDVRLLIISIIFVGILAFAVDVLFRSFIYGGSRRRNDKDSGNGLMLVALLVAAVAYLLTILFKFALSRKREFLADAGAVQMTRNSMAMASALRKISGNDRVEDVRSEDVKQLFISNQALSGLSGLFATHPPIEKRIAVLEQM